jgi:hypothetical protein
VLLPDGGLAVLRSGQRRAVLDYGTHGYLSIAAHAHADALRLDVTLGDAELVVDPGVGSYFGRPRAREAFRSTAFHATVTVDGANSSVSGGPFLWARQATARLLAADLAREVVVAEHDGYLRLDDPVLHRRAVIGIDEAILVVDRMQAEGVHAYSQRWPLHPELELDERHADRVVARGGGRGLVISLAASGPFELAAVRGCETPFSGWWSERLEALTPSWVVSADAQVEGVFEIAALVLPLESVSPPDVRVELGPGERGTRIGVVKPEGEVTIELDLGTSNVELPSVTSRTTLR